MNSIYHTFDFGYDPSVPEAAPLSPPPPRVGALPPSAAVNYVWLPPVRKQTMPNCFVWASTYGLLTYWAAQAGDYPPVSASQQAGPDYTYIQVEVNAGVATDSCLPGHMTDCLEWVIKNGGTPSLASAPNIGTTEAEKSCAANWSTYGPPNPALPADASFAIPAYKTTTITGADGLDNIRAVIASGVPLAYGCCLYTDFPKYKGKAIPIPYVGSGQWLLNPNGDKVGHCMMVIAYDDNQGAFLIQNSFGTGWGTDGLVLMAYETFQKTAQSYGFYIPASGN